MSDSPLISVIVPMRNGEPYVRETIQSLLNQTGVDVEVVVVNDGSTDASPQTVQSMNDARVRMIDGPCRGISASFNAGLAAARGTFVARCDADDLFTPGRLAAQLSFLDSHLDFGAVCSGYSMTDSVGNVVKPFVPPENPPTDVTDELLAGVGRSHMSAYLFRTEMLRLIGGCREWFVSSEDADLQFRLAGVTRVGYLPIDAYLYRLHDHSITHVQADARRQFYGRCAVEFAKQRAAGQQDNLALGRPPAPPAASDKAVQTTGSQIANMLVGQAWAAHDRGEKSAAIKTGIRAARYAPLSPRAWSTVMKLILKPVATQPTRSLRP